MDIRVPTVSQILVYFSQFALTGCIHEFCSVLRLYHMNTHIETVGQERDRFIFYVYVVHMKLRFLKIVAHRSSSLDLFPFAQLCDILSSAQIQSHTL